MVKVRKMKPIAPGNPFLSDLSNMGTQIGKNVTVMHWNHVTERQKWIIVVNMETGERLKIILE